MLMQLLKNIYKNLNGNSVHGANRKRIPIKKQKEYLEMFDAPKDDYERSFFKYKCFCEFCYYKKKWLIVIYNIGAMLLYPFVFKKLKAKGINKKKSEQCCDAVVENVPRLRNDDVIPEELTRSFGTIKEISELDYKKIYLTSKAIEICKILRKRYFWHFYFRLITTVKIAQFNEYIQEYNPKMIVFYSCEREFSGPLQTLLCESEGTEYVSFMHGDYLYSLCFAFQRYSRYYTWDEAYNQMFSKLKCDCPMIVYRPKKLEGIADCKDEHQCKYFATYYFSDETRQCAEIIYSIFHKFEKEKLRCKIRPHPRFSDIDMLKSVFPDIEIEDPSNYSLADSITDSLYIVGLNTTVLSQAYYSGKKIVIDDISMHDQYLELKEKEYIMLNRQHILLSDVVKELNENNHYDATYQFKYE